MIENFKKFFLKNIIIFIDVFLLSFLLIDLGISNKINLIIPSELILILLLMLTSFLFSLNIKIYFNSLQKSKNILHLISSIILLITLIVCMIMFVYFQDKMEDVKNVYVILISVLEFGLILYFLVRILILVKFFYEIYYNPTIMFVGSFFVIIIIGSILLYLPISNTSSISFLDSIFTSTSAVCVTGLTVLDVEKSFTYFGKIVIMVLFQLGGLGVLTFTSFFSYFFKSNSFKEGLNTQNFIASEGLQNVFRIALNIVLFTISVEIIGAIVIYLSIRDIGEIHHKLFFSIFHSISAYCNAGFSTISSGLYDNNLKFLYVFQWIVMMLIIFGGLGHNIFFNIYRYFKYKLIKLLKLNSIIKTRRYERMTLNSKIVIYTTAVLLFFGTIILFASEYNNTLLIHDTFFGKITNSAFNSVTPRTAGFNTVDMTQFTIPTILIIIFLMWIGASPASTGGGIKTSTFAIATLNTIAIASGNQRIRIAGRRISSDSTLRAFAIISISLIIIGLGIIGLFYFEPKNASLINIVFECFSAYSTVGLSLGYTSTITDGSKIIIMLLMFFGRIGTLNFLYGLMKKTDYSFYEYPVENIIIT